MSTVFMFKVTVVFAAVALVMWCVARFAASTFSEYEKIQMRFDNRRMLEHKMFFASVIVGYVTRAIAIVCAIATTVMWAVRL